MRPFILGSIYEYKLTLICFMSHCVSWILWTFVKSLGGKTLAWVCFRLLAIKLEKLISNSFINILSAIRCKNNIMWDVRQQTMFWFICSGSEKLNIQSVLIHKICVNTEVQFNPCSFLLNLLGKLKIKIK